LGKISWLTPNEHELAILTGMPTKTSAEIAAAARALLMQGACNVVVTCGARGAFWASKAGGKWFPAPVVKVMDTVGSGDFFNGVLASQIILGKKFENALNKTVTFTSKWVANRR
jgi:ribokinase